MKINFYEISPPPDSLWTNVQRNFIAFVNQNNGNASLGNPVNIKARPDYSIVQKYLRKEMDMETLKILLGC